MRGGPSSAIKICGQTLEAACGTNGDGIPYENDPFDCKDCDTVTIYDGFVFDRSLATARPKCQAVFTFLEDYGDVYYRDGRLYDAFDESVSKCAN